MDDVWRYRWRAALLIQRRDLWAVLFSPAIYATLAISLLAASLLLRNTLTFVAEKGLTVLADPLAFPLFLTVLLSALFLAVSSTATIARERDRGVLEVLFYGPVDHVAYILGKYLAQMVTYLAMTAIYIPCFLLYALLTHIRFDPRLLAVVLLSVFTTSTVIAFGILISALTRTVRLGLIILLGVIFIFLAIQIGHQLLISIPPPEKYYNPFLFLRRALGVLDQGVAWLSPFAYLRQGMDALTAGDLTRYVISLLVSLAYTGVLLALGVVGLRWRGVRG